MMSVSGAASARFISAASPSVSNVQPRGRARDSSCRQSETWVGTKAPDFGPHRSATSATRVRPGFFAASCGSIRRMAIASQGTRCSSCPPATPKRQSMPAPPKFLPLRYGPVGESISTRSLCPGAGGRSTARR